MPLNFEWLGVMPAFGCNTIPIVHVMVTSTCIKHCRTYVLKTGLMFFFHFCCIWSFCCSTLHSVHRKKQKEGRIPTFFHHKLQGAKRSTWRLQFLLHRKKQRVVSTSLLLLTTAYHRGLQASFRTPPHYRVTVIPRKNASARDTMDAAGDRTFCPRQECPRA